MAAVPSRSAKQGSLRLQEKGRARSVRPVTGQAWAARAAPHAPAAPFPPPVRVHNRTAPRGARVRQARAKRPQAAQRWTASARRALRARAGRVQIAALRVLRLRCASLASGNRHRRPCHRTAAARRTCRRARRASTHSRRRRARAIACATTCWHATHRRSTRRRRPASHRTEFVPRALPVIPAMVARARHHAPRVTLLRLEWVCARSAAQDMPHLQPVQAASGAKRGPSRRQDQASARSAQPITSQQLGHQHAHRGGRVQLVTASPVLAR